MAINLLIKSFIEQNNFITSKIYAELHPAERSSSKKEHGELISDPELLPGVKDFPGPTPKLEHLKKMHEAIMTKKFYEASETSKSYTEKLTETNMMEKEIESSLTARECEVTHYIQNNFERMSQALVCKLRKDFQKKKITLSTKSQRGQRVNIENLESFLEQIIDMQRSSLSYLLTVLFSMLEDGHKNEVNLMTLQQILFFLNLSKQNKTELDCNLEARISNHVVNMLKLTVIQEDVSVHSVIKQLVEILLTMSESSSFSMQLLQCELDQMETKDSKKLQEFTMMSLKQLVSKEITNDGERIMLKKLLLRHISYR